MKKYLYILSTIIFVVIFISCEEITLSPLSSSDAIPYNPLVGVWQSISYEQYANTDCTDSLTDITSSYIDIGYSEKYELLPTRFTWIKTVNILDNIDTLYIEEGQYTIEDSVMKLIGYGDVHRSRLGMMNSEQTLMAIIHQADINDNFIYETCFRFTYEKIESY